MELPESDRSHVFNTSRTALKGAVQGSKLFITGAASAVLGSLTRVETVHHIDKNGTGDFVITVTGRRFSVQTGRGLGELDIACCACTLTPSLEKVFKQLLTQRKRARVLNTFDFASLPSDIFEHIEALVDEGKQENLRIQARGRRLARTLDEVIAPVPQKVRIFRPIPGEDRAGFFDFILPPLTKQIEEIEGRFYAVTVSNKTFELGPKTHVTLRRLLARRRHNNLTCETTTRIKTP
jgi:hypothetical protein